METRFELNTKMLNIKSDDKFLYLALFESKCTIKIAFADIKKSAKYLLTQTLDTKRTD